MTNEDIIRMAREAGVANSWDINWFDPYYARFAKLVAAAEREACAKVCDAYDVAEDVNSSDTAEGIAIAIRARREQ